MVKLIDMKLPGLTTFEMIRQRDETGLSLQTVDNKEQVVLEGVVFHDGTVAIHWRSSYWSVTFFPDWTTFVNVHIGAHPTNGTVIRFDYRGPNDGTLATWRQEDELAGYQ